MRHTHRRPATNAPRVAPVLVLAGSLALPVAASAGEIEAPSYLADRGTGLPSSMVGTYIPEGQLLLFPFVTYATDSNREYVPKEFGLVSDEGFLGTFESSAVQLFAAYGLTDWLALELEAAYLHAEQTKSPDDPYPTPARTVESGLTDFEGQVRFRVSRESVRSPEIFGFVEVTAPSNRDAFLIGDETWDFRPGLGLVKGFSWGTVTFRTIYEYNRDDHHPDIGETAFEYVKRLSPAWRFVAAFEGGETGAIDEWELTTGAHWRLTDVVSLRLDNTVGVSSKATDWSPQLGVMFGIPGNAAE